MNTNPLVDTLQKQEEEFRKQFDELGLKAPQGKSMPGLERELIINWLRSDHETLLRAVVDELRTKAIYMNGKMVRFSDIEQSLLEAIKREEV